MEKRKSFLSVKEMVEMALLVALAVVLDLDGFKISLSADGGSIGFTMVPLFILGYRHGFFKSLIGVGVIYGLTTALLDGHGLIYYPFDYEDDMNFICNDNDCENCFIFKFYSCFASCKKLSKINNSTCS